MLTATKSGTNIILKTSLTVSYQLERKVDTGPWESWDGSVWGGSAISLTTQNFTDYDLSDGVYQYRTNVSGVYDYSTCIVIGSGAVGWTFGNYTVPDGLFGELLTSDDLKYSFLWGIDLTASNGQTWTEEQTKKNIEWSVFQLEKALNIDIFPREYYCDDLDNESVVTSKYVIKEFPYPNRRKHKNTIVSRHRPVREVTRLDLYSPTDDKILNILPWLRLDKYKGVFYTYPKQGKVLSYTTNSLPWLNYIAQVNYRDAYHIDYKTGYETAELIPEDLREIIGMIAAMKLLNVIGDGLLAGFSSSSIGLDGMNESFSSTQGVENAYFGARINVYKQTVADYISENRNKYGNFRIGAI